MNEQVTPTPEAPAAPAAPTTFASVKQGDEPKKEEKKEEKKLDFKFIYIILSIVTI